MLSGKNVKSICKSQLFVKHIKVLYNVIMVSMGELTKSSSFEMTLFIFL